MNSNPLVWADLWAAMKAKPDEWIETTEEMAVAMMNALPPRAGLLGRFLVGEPSHDGPDGRPLYACFVETRCGHVARYLSLHQFKTMKVEGCTITIEIWRHPPATD